MPESEAIDISHWNPITDWDDIPEFDLWCMKATEGKTFRSPVFNERWQEIRDRNVKYRGAYHWIRSDSSARVQVANLKRAIDDHGGLEVGEFIMLDWETTPGIANVTLAKVEEWLALAEKEWPGRIIVYASDWVPHFDAWRKKNPKYPLWYANYNTGASSRGGKAETDKYGADVWQWTSTALVPGFKAGIDMNDVLEWSTIARISGTTVSQPLPNPPSGIQSPAPAPAPAPATTKGTKLNWLSDLKYKSSGNNPNAVIVFQGLMKSLGYSIQVDGAYGPQSAGICRLFQIAHKLTVDEWVGPQTWNAAASDGPKGRAEQDRG